jgi:hypothetical protein
MNKSIPCINCLKFPICRNIAIRNKEFQICDDLAHYMDRFCDCLSTAFLELNDYYLYPNGKNENETDNQGLYIYNYIWL